MRLFRRLPAVLRITCSVTRRTYTFDHRRTWALRRFWDPEKGWRARGQNG